MITDIRMIIWSSQASWFACLQKKCGMGCDVEFVGLHRTTFHTS